MFLPEQPFFELLNVRKIVSKFSGAGHRNDERHEWKEDK